MDISPVVSAVLRGIYHNAEVLTAIFVLQSRLAANDMSFCSNSTVGYFELTEDQSNIVAGGGVALTANRARLQLIQAKVS